VSDAAPGRLLVAAPLRIEARALRRGAPALHVLHTGAGPRRARRAADRLLLEPADCVVVAGLCGALDAELAPGDVVLATEVRGPERRTALAAAGALRRSLDTEGLRVLAAPIVSVDHVVRGNERRVWSARGARAVDMESAWLAPGAGGRPLAVVRVVLDGPGHELLRPSLGRHWRAASRSLEAVARALARWKQAPPQPAAAGAEEA